jgi:hypothetical protein
MVYIGIDASYSSCGYVIISESSKTIELGTLTPQKYDGQKYNRRYDHFFFNSLKIFDALMQRLLRYRHDNEFVFGIEEIAINGWKHGGTNSVYNLVFEVGILSGLCSKTLNVPVAPNKT